MSFLDKVMVKPWEHAGEMDGIHGGNVTDMSASRTGLFVFLAVISSMFLLFIISYYSRSQFPDWEVLTDPGILWINTLVLVLASVTFQLASNAAKQNSLTTMGYFLVASAILTLVFVAGQFTAWEQLLSAGFYAYSNPANAFFYLITGLHAVHLLGGLWFMLLLAFRLKKKEDNTRVIQSVALCATYWHYLLLVWLVLFTLLLRT